MVKSKYIKYLQTLKYLKKNPFTNKNYFIISEETFSDGIDVHKIANVIISFKKKLEVQIITNENGIAIASYILFSILSNNFIGDSSKIIKINDEVIKNDDSIDNFKRVIDILNNNNKTLKIITIFYSNNDDGENAYDVLKQTIWYEVKEEKLDDYYLNIENQRWYDIKNNYKKELCIEDEIEKLKNETKH